MDDNEALRQWRDKQAWDLMENDDWKADWAISASEHMFPADIGDEAHADMYYTEDEYDDYDVELFEAMDSMWKVSFLFLPDVFDEELRLLEWRAW